MGCSLAGTASEPITEVNRRRLSLGEVDMGPETPQGDANVSEEDRHLLLHLSERGALQFCSESENEDRRFSVVSETDKDMNKVPSFASKDFSHKGDPFDARLECMGYVCKKGLKPECPNQDSFFIMKVESKFSLYGVFDGHGRKGHDISNFVKDNLPKLLLRQKGLARNPLECLTLAFEKTQDLIEKATRMNELDGMRSGSTASVVLHFHSEDRNLYVAHVGDSRVVMGRKTSSTPEEAWLAADLTEDHKPNIPEERARIEKAGGMVSFDGGWNYRVYVKGKRDARGKRYPGLNMSRSMGDMAGFYDAGISAVPDVSANAISISPEPMYRKDDSKGKDRINGKGDQEGPANTSGEGRRASTSSNVSLASRPSVSSYSIAPGSDKFILLCSDGVWEFISSQEAVDAVGRFKKDEAPEAAELLAKLAWERWTQELGGEVVDDITALVVHFD
mmetsp:Transcript_37581/g.79864  ORF Transcript_37581/g.79864 Transcript_37581/m.79864 type:complete len:449 (-) Transcript_37581:79-1425(-)